MMQSNEIRWVRLGDYITQRREKNNNCDVPILGVTRDGFEIRKYATENNVTVFTSLDTVKVLLDVLEDITITISTIDA